jgi:alpha-tubulin suppressor-like RCC1 family protein
LTFTSLSVSGHRCALAADGTAYCWGSNDGGQLGTGDRVDRRAPTPVAGGLHFTSITTGEYHTCAIATDGTVYCWGDPYSTFSIPELMLTPQPTPGTLKFASIDAGVGFTCGVTTDAKAYCWGVGYDGRLGDGMSHESREPSLVAGGLSFTSVSAEVMACGLTTSGAVYCWGEGYLGAGPFSQSAVPVAIAGGLSFTSLNVANVHACALSTGGRVYCWGENNHGQLGDGTREVSYVPVAVLGQQ